MSVEVMSVEKGSPAAKAGVKAGDRLVSINGNEIMDVLDYRFFQFEKRLLLLVERGDKTKKLKLKKDEFAECGMEFSTYLMDKQHSCRNKCIFCFIDQMPKGMRESLYFKDDDSRLSFLFGNYITLTNITEHEVERIIKMHISPINISVHTTNPDLRCKMMNNRFAGDSLSVLYRLADAGIALNCQLVLVPGINDDAELRRSLEDLTKCESVGCVACVPVGLTRHREGLPQLKSFDKSSASEVLDIINEFGDRLYNERGERVCYAADEFYLLAEREIPKADFYGDFLQLENGVGLWALLKSEAESALTEIETLDINRKVSVVTGELASPLLREIAGNVSAKFQNFTCDVYPIENNFFGPKITVAGLVTARDIIDQLKGKDLGEEAFIPRSMLRQGEDRFLDDITLSELSTELNVKITPVDNDGYDLIYKLLGR